MAIAKETAERYVNSSIHTWLSQIFFNSYRRYNHCFFIRDGMQKMKDVYQKNTALGDPGSIDKQLEENAQKLDQLRGELQKYEVSNISL